MTLTNDQMSIGLRGIVGTSMPILAVLAPWQDQIAWALGCLVGLLTIASLAITILKQVKRKG